VNFLEARNIPYELLDNTSSEKNKTIRKLGRIIDFISQPESGQKFFDLMNECFLLDSYDSEADSQEPDAENKTVGQRVILSGFLKMYPVEKLLYPIGGEIERADIPKDLVASDIWADFTEKLELVRELLEFPSTIVEKLILFISEKLRFEREERAIAQKVAGDVRYLMSQDPHWKIADLALELLSPKNIFNFFAGIVWDLKGYEPKPGVVTLATYHKSKGLEWDVVFLTSLTNADFPVSLDDKFIGEYWFLKEAYKNPQAIIKSDVDKLFGGKSSGDSIVKSKIETIAERARLLYVGITRAKDTCQKSPMIAV
jgi:DNA helicase-2/ATP-dependent DNA helicase PcrA